MLLVLTTGGTVAAGTEQTLQVEGVLTISFIPEEGFK